MKKNTYIFVKNIEEMSKLVFLFDGTKKIDELYGYGMYYLHKYIWRINKFPTILEVKNNCILGHMPIEIIIQDEKTRKKYAKWIKKSINLETFLNKENIK